MPTQRYKLIVAYRGTRYHGWQRQLPNKLWKGEPLALGEGIPTIQERLMNALVSVVHHPVEVVGSSRTDAGVHAKGQLVHFDTTSTQIPPEGLRLAANSRLPSDIVIRSVEPVPDDFDARKWTVRKRYQYAIWNHRDRHIFASDLCWHRHKPHDVEAMREAAARFIGTHDFTSFARPGHGREHAVRTIHECSVSHRGGMIVVGVTGSGFLWNMVRIIVGTLSEVGLGQRRPEEIDAMLAAKDRTAAGGTAPAHGLYLQWVETRPPVVEPAHVDEPRPPGSGQASSSLPQGHGATETATGGAQIIADEPDEGMRR